MRSPWVRLGDEKVLTLPIIDDLIFELERANVS